MWHYISDCQSGWENGYFCEMRTLKIRIPDNLELNDREAVMMLASKLYEKGKFSLGQAAKFAGLSKRAFMEILNDYDVSVINHPVADIDSDIKNAKSHSI